MSRPRALTSDHWVPDEMVRTCSGCNAPFNHLNRKHHCRLCGNVFCKKCTLRRLNYADWALRDERGCESCYVYISQTLPTLERPTQFVHFTRTGSQVSVNVRLGRDHADVIVEAIDEIRDGPLLAGSDETRKDYPVSAYHDIMDGQQSAVFKTHLPGMFAMCLGDNVTPRAPLCFSLSFGAINGTLDLEAPHGDLKRSWVAAFKSHVVRHRTPGGQVFFEMKKRSMNDVHARMQQQKDNQEIAKMDKRRAKRADLQKHTDAIREKYRRT
eukprot:TRINITY_DN6271_c0_g1_i2.p1 TRINITY_DN6271_c0_g1~~TRINITY_DN6271_c0_g1_i2.p1  ORF type:complete len:269 (-),score=29.13 TRINITY_DN6271_c0_g1_i2:882-1688(-)